MGLSTASHRADSHLIIALDEKFDFATVHDFKEAYTDIPSEVKVIEVDLSNTEYMDSSALGMLLNMQKNLSGREIEFRISHCRPQVARILKISRFDKKFIIS